VGSTGAPSVPVEPVEPDGPGPLKWSPSPGPRPKRPPGPCPSPKRPPIPGASSGAPRPGPALGRAGGVTPHASAAALNASRSACVGLVPSAGLVMPASVRQVFCSSVRLSSRPAWSGRVGSVMPHVWAAALNASRSACVGLVPSAGLVMPASVRQVFCSSVRLSWPPR